MKMKRTVFNPRVIRRFLYLAILALPISVQAETTRVSVSSEGEEANAHSFFPDLSQDGRYVAFVSEADNLVTGDTNEDRDVFMYDRVTGETKRVSVSSDGTEANSGSGAENPVISGDGRYIAFASVASNLVPGDNNGVWDIFIHDNQSSLTQRVSVNSDSTEANGGSWGPDISTDGRFVTFDSHANNLVSGDTNGQNDIFVRDLETGLNSRVNVASDGTQANAGNIGYWGFWHTYPISADGRYVAFTSPADNLVTGDQNGNEDVFVHDRETGVTQRISVSSTGAEGNGSSLLEDMSADGRFVVFISDSTNLSPDVDGGLFLHDRDTGETIEIPGGWYAAISDNGRYIVFSSSSDKLVPWDSNDYRDVFVFDQQTERMTRVNTAYSGGEANKNSFGVAISGDGKHVGLNSAADNLVPEDSNGSEDVFVTENPLLFLINPGLNDAWYNPVTDGQGFSITVFPVIGKVSLTWTTYDTELPLDGVIANLGDPGHRWFNALGSYAGNQAVMKIKMTSGGIFDTDAEVTRVADGTIILTFTNCSNGTVEYDIPSIGQSGVVPIRRVVGDNVALCEALSSH